MKKSGKKQKNMKKCKKHKRKETQKRPKVIRYKICKWAKSSEIMRHYHDNAWRVPIHNDRIHFTSGTNKMYKIYKEAILNLMCLLSMLISNHTFAFSDIVNTKPRGLILNTIPTKTNDQVVASDGFLKKSITTVKENRSSIYNNRYDISKSKSQFNKDHEFIFFYSNTCHYCKRFIPVLEKYSNNFGIKIIKIRSFVLGEKPLVNVSVNSSSNQFSNNNVVDQENNVADQEIVERFFGRATNASVPILFVMNKNNLHAYPVSQGALGYLELVERMNKLKQRILQHERSITINMEQNMIVRQRDRWR